MVQGGYAYSILETTSLHPSSLKRLLVERDKKEKKEKKKRTDIIACKPRTPT